MTEETTAPEIIGRFADPFATNEVDLGPCRCPGQPHERDSADVRTEVGDGEWKAIRSAGYHPRISGETIAISDEYDWEAGNDAAIARLVTSWTMVGADGDMVPITRLNASLLDEATRQKLLEACNDARRGDAIPKASGRRSPGSSQGRGSRTPTPRRRR